MPQCAWLSFPFSIPHFNAWLNNTGAQTCLREFPLFVPQLNTIHHIFHTFTAGWSPESNKASFLMMLPTPGMMAWSRSTSHSILLLWPLTACLEWEKLNFGEHTSKLCMALTFCSQSSVNLQGHTFDNAECSEMYGCCYKVNWGLLGLLYF